MFLVALVYPGRLFKKLIALSVYCWIKPGFYLGRLHLLFKKGQTNIKTRELAIGEKQAILQMSEEGNWPCLSHTFGGHWSDVAL